MLTQLADLVQYGQDYVGRPPRGAWRTWEAWAAVGRGFPVGLVLAAVVVAGLVAAVIVLSVRLARRGRRPSEAIEIAKARYARGEISKSEFEELKKDLS